MKYLVTFSFCLFSSSAFASLEFAEIQFKKGAIKHTYQIKSNKMKSFISLKDGKGKSQIKIMNQARAEDLIAEANRIVWKSAYRKPASQKKCTEYLIIAIDESKPEIVCQENRLATAHAYGFINKLSQIVESPKGH